MAALLDKQSRLKTFQNWPHDFIRPENLAEVGFYYLNSSDRVKCPFCGVIINNWEPFDDALQEHMKWSAHCPFLKTLQHRQARNGYIAEDTCGMYGVEVASERRERQLEQDRGRKPRFPQFARKDQRLLTFTDWPKAMKQTPESLAEAGFFYRLVGDRTICFYCGIGLKDWEVYDEPWQEHAKQSPECEYVRLHKGEEFIKEALCKNEPRVEEKENLVNGAEEEAAHSMTCKEVGKEDLATGTVKEPTSPSAVTCKVCLDKDVQVVFVPCGHTACLECAPALGRCHLCRKPIERYIRLYMH